MHDLSGHSMSYTQGQNLVLPNNSQTPPSNHSHPFEALSTPHTPNGNDGNLRYPPVVYQPTNLISSGFEMKR